MCIRPICIIHQRRRRRKISAGTDLECNAGPTLQSRDCPLFPPLYRMGAACDACDSTQALAGTLRSDAPSWWSIVGHFAECAQESSRPAPYPRDPLSTHGLTEGGFGRVLITGLGHSSPFCSLPAISLTCARDTDRGFLSLP
jgi:hypothetical protein